MKQVVYSVGYQMPLTRRPELVRFSDVATRLPCRFKGTGCMSTDDAIPCATCNETKGKPHSLDLVLRGHAAMHTLNACYLKLETIPIVIVKKGHGYSLIGLSA